MSAWWSLIALGGGAVLVYGLIEAGARRMFNHVDQPKRDETAPDPTAPGGTS